MTGMVALFCFLILASSNNPFCGDFPGPAFESGKLPKYTGTYSNPYYGFSVKIPKGLVGHNTPPPAPDRGFGVLLSSSPRSYIHFLARDGGSEPPEAIEQEHLEWLKEGAKEILSVKHIKTKLGSLNARRHIATYTCHNNPEVFIEDELIAVSADRHIAYEVGLLTCKSRYKKDKIIFEQVLKTWRLIPIIDYWAKPEGE